MGNNPLDPGFFPVIGLLIVAVPWGLAALVLYVIIRFGVKHGMRSYFAEAARRAVPVDGIIGARATDPTAVYPDEDTGTDWPGGAAR
jgi:hypothetical protein